MGNFPQSSSEIILDISRTVSLNKFILDMFHKNCAIGISFHSTIKSFHLSNSASSYQDATQENNITNGTSFNNSIDHHFSISL